MAAPHLCLMFRWACAWSAWECPGGQGGFPLCSPPGPGTLEVLHRWVLMGNPWRQTPVPGKSFPQTPNGRPLPPPSSGLTWPSSLLQQPHFGGEGEPRAGCMPSKGHGGDRGWWLLGLLREGRRLPRCPWAREEKPPSGPSWNSGLGGILEPGTLVPEPGRTPRWLKHRFQGPCP